MANTKDNNSVDWFRQASPYINAHRGSIFVISFAGDALTSSGFPNLIHDIALLSHLGIKLVLVPGIRPQIDSRLKQRGISAQYVDGLRVTDDQTLPVVKEAAGVVRVEIESMLSMGLVNTPMSGARLRVTSGNFVTARPYGVHDGIDFFHTGAIRKIDTAAIHCALDQGQLVMLSPLGYSSTGDTFNLRTEDVAMQAAIDLQADKLIYMLSDHGVRDSRRKIIRQLNPAGCDSLINGRRKLDEVTQTCLQNAARACRHGVPRTHLLGYMEDGALLTELFTRDGCGTMIDNDVYESVRDAQIEDIAGINALIEPLQADGTLARRSVEQIENDLEHFSVIERDGMIIACGALFPYPNGLAELAALVVHSDYSNAGRAEQMLKTIENRALSAGAGQLFVLTTRTAHWFRERGFQLGDIKQLPLKKRQLYNYRRNSKVFVKTL
ncbi:MAG: amino-acid N-acetyltransferase [Pseudomonadota bacterium]